MNGFPDGWPADRTRQAVEMARELLAAPEQEMEARRAVLREPKPEGWGELVKVYRLNPGAEPRDYLLHMKATEETTRPFAVLSVADELGLMARQGHEAEDLAQIAAGDCLMLSQSPAPESEAQQ